jgi:hypothetical protein
MVQAEDKRTSTTVFTKLEVSPEVRLHMTVFFYGSTWSNWLKKTDRNYFYDCLSNLISKTFDRRARL